jgi:hypothetical protein
LKGDKMKVKDMGYRFKKGYHRPVSLPIYKWIVVCISWIICLLFYILAMVSNLWFVTGGIIFQAMSMLLPDKWDTENWKSTKEGKEYIEKYK